MSHRRESRAIPRLEVLEDRCTPAVITVNAASTSNEIDHSKTDNILTLTEAITLLNRGMAEFNRLSPEERKLVDRTTDALGTNDRIVLKPPSDWIRASSALPAIEKRVVIDGNNVRLQPWERVATSVGDGLKVEAGGAGTVIGGLRIIGFSGNGITISANGVKVEDCTIQQNGGDGIRIVGLREKRIDNNSVSRNLILGNRGNGVFVNLADNTVISQNKIGANGGRKDAALGPGTFAENAGVKIIRADKTKVLGNEIGMVEATAATVVFKFGEQDNDAETAALISSNWAGLRLGNRGFGIFVGLLSKDTEVGSGKASGRNHISGNTLDGVRVEGTDKTQIVGNEIGLNLAGTSAMDNNRAGTGNLGHGVALNGARDAIVRKNVISRNGKDGINVASARTTVTIADNRIGTTPEFIKVTNTSVPNGLAAIRLFAGTVTVEKNTGFYNPGGEVEAERGTKLTKKGNTLRPALRAAKDLDVLFGYGTEVFGLVTAALDPDGEWLGGGTFTATALVNSEEIDPGDGLNVGGINFAADVHLTSATVTTIDIYGSAASGAFDEVGITGDAVLGGTLNVNLHGYTPSLGESFKILDLPSGYTGTFDAVVAPTFSGGTRAFAVAYNANDVTLTVVSTPSAPTVSGVSASSGSTAGGQTVTITGTNFSAVQAVLFGTTPALGYVVNSSTQITAIAPPHAAGATTAQVVTAAGSASSAYTFNAATAPAVTALSSSAGYLEGNTTVTITGTDLTGATAVMFGSTPALFFVVTSGTSITAYVPDAAAAGMVDVRVTTFAGTSAIVSADEFTFSQQPAPTLSSLGASTGATAGGTTVTITGTGFENVTAVYFGDVAADFVVSSPTSITATAPPQYAGTYDVVVGTYGGASASSSASRFSYTSPGAPALTTLSSSSGGTAGGTVVTITGTRLADAIAVYFGDTRADFAVASDTSLIAVAPRQAAGAVNVTVVTYSGTSAQTGSAVFTYNAPSPPTVSALDVSTGGSGGGTAVTVTGTNFTSAMSVLFGDVPAENVYVLSDTALIAVAPAQAAGTVDVRVTTDGGTSATSSADEFTVSSAGTPTVTGLSSPGGPATGGTAVEVFGTNLRGATTVLFGTVSAQFQVIDDTTLLAYAPPGVAGTVDVVVTTHSGTSSTSSADEFDYSAVNPPAISSLSTSSGSTAGGTVVTLTGTGFDNVSGVLFGGTPAVFEVNDDTQLTVIAPAHAAGVFDIVLTGVAGDSARTSSTRFTFSLASAPAISSLATSSGSTGGGTKVVITGTDFLGATEVRFGDVSASSFVIDSPTQITAYSPEAAAGTVHVRVFTHAGSSVPVSGDLFTFNAPSAPTVTALATSGGGTGGGTLVTLTGTDFTGVTSVRFDSVEASFVVKGATSISAWAPAQAAGTVNVRVTTAGGTSGTGAGNSYTYSAASAPSVTGLLTDTGDTAAGTAVTVIGSNFTGASAVKFGTLDAQSFRVLSDTVIVAYSPMRAAGTVHVTVTTPSGTSSTTSADEFDYTNLTASVPAVTGLDITTGSSAGGMTVTITGTDLTGASGVSFGGTAATSFVIDSDSQITAVAPAGSAGTVHVTVTTNNGTSSTSSADEFEYLAAAAPAVSSLGTGTGGTAGGTSVAITGTDFTGATEVYFGSIPAASFVVNSATSITATSPAGYAGVVDVTVVTPSGTSATSSSDEFTFTLSSLPAVSSLGTGSGTTAGGTSVAITGTDFTGSVGVYFGDTPAASFVVNSGTSITATTPAGYAGDVDVRVVTTAGASAPASGARYSFTLASAPTVSSLGTSSGSTAGGVSVTITGTNFAGVTAVYFGGVAADFTVVSSTTITATSPVQGDGVVDLVVWTTAGSSQVSSSDEYTVNAASAPTVSSLGTSTGGAAGGTTVVITGTNFTSATRVLFGDVAASYVIDSPTQITATAPAQAAGTVDVTVTTGGGTSATSSSDEFVYSAGSSPSVADLATTSGSAAGGTPVVISGANFAAATAVHFGGDEASFELLSDGSILAYAPGGTGTVNVTVTTTSGTSSTSSADEFTYTSVTAPSISSLSAFTGTTAGGTSVTITGTGLLNATSVTFGGVAADFLVVSPTSISLTTPASVAGAVDVVVSIPGASSTPARFTFTAASAPAVTSLGTSTGGTAGGTSVTITGTDFTGTSAVFFGGVSASFEVVSSTSIIATAPSAAAAGVVDVVVQTPTGTSEVTSSDEFTYTSSSAPTLSALSLTSGPAAGGTRVNLTGTNYVGTTSVKFGSDEASFVVMSPTWIVATAPAHASGTASVTVTSAGGTSSGITYTYNAPSAPTVTGLSDDSGPDYGGESITILGTNFIGVTSVQFGSEDAAFTVISDTAIRATVPAGSAGTEDVTVTTAGGTSSTSSADEYTYSAGTSPSISSLSTSSGGGAGGTLVTITGTGFTDATSVLFGSVPASSWVVNSSTKITAVSPAHASGAIDITVSNPAGTSSTSGSTQFTYSAASSPAVTSVGPNAGKLAGGGSVLITGTNLLGTSDVKFGSTSATSFTVLSATQILAVAPSGSAGTVNVTVTTPAATSSTSSANEYAYQAAPAISSLSVSGDTATGGVRLVITGTDLLGATAVYFGDTPATPYSTSATTVTVYVPAHAAGAVDLSVLAPGGESAPTSFTYTSASTVTWTGGASGSWATGANWSGGSVPLATDDVVIPSGKTVTLSSGTADAHQLSVAGALVVSGGTFTLYSTGSVATLTLSGGTLTGGGALAVTSSFTWSGGALSGVGDFTLGASATGTISVSGTATRSNGNLVNRGSLTWTGGTLSLGQLLVNLPGATFTASRTSGTQTVSGGGGVLNSGTLTKTGAGTTVFSAGVESINTATINVSGGTLALWAGMTAGTVSISSGAELQISGSYQLLSTSSVTGSGTLRVTSGGSLTLMGGTLSATGGLIINSGATVQGSGTVGTNVTNNGTLIVGGLGTVGILAITGNYAQGSGATLKMDITGTGAGTGHDQLQVSGSVTLAGTLQMTVTGSYTAGTAFQLITFASRTGTFGSITGASGMTAQYNSTDFTLLASADSPAPPPDDEGDTPPARTPARRPEEEDAPPRRRFWEDEGAVLVYAGAEAENHPEAPGPDAYFLAMAGEEPSGEAAPNLPSLDELLAMPFELLAALLGGE